MSLSYKVIYFFGVTGLLPDTTDLSKKTCSFVILVKSPVIIVEIKRLIIYLVLNFSFYFSDFTGSLIFRLNRTLVMRDWKKGCVLLLWLNHISQYKLQNCFVTQSFIYKYGELC